MKTIKQIYQRVSISFIPNFILTEKLPTIASNEVRQCDMVEHQSIPDDTTIDEEEMIFEKKVVELIRENETLKRITRKLTRKRILKERMAELENSNTNLIKQIEKEKIRSSQGWLYKKKLKKRN